MLSSSMAVILRPSFLVPSARAPTVSMELDRDKLFKEVEAYEKTVQGSVTRRSILTGVVAGVIGAGIGGAAFGGIGSIANIVGSNADAVTVASEVDKETKERMAETARMIAETESKIKSLESRSAERVAERAAAEKRVAAERAAAERAAEIAADAEKGAAKQAGQAAAERAATEKAEKAAAETAEKAERAGAERAAAERAAKAAADKVETAAADKVEIAAADKVETAAADLLVTEKMDSKPASDAATAGENMPSLAAALSIVGIQQGASKLAAILKDQATQLNLGMPRVDLPRVDLPKVDLPKVDLPNVDLGGVGASLVGLTSPLNFGEYNGPIVGALGVAAVAEAAALLGANSKAKEKEAQARELLMVAKEQDSQAQRLQQALGAARVQAAEADARVKEIAALGLEIAAEAQNKASPQAALDSDDQSFEAWLEEQLLKARADADEQREEVHPLCRGSNVAVLMTRRDLSSSPYS